MLRRIKEVTVFLIGRELNFIFPLKQRGPAVRKPDIEVGREVCGACRVRQERCGNAKTGLILPRSVWGSAVLLTHVP